MRGQQGWASAEGHGVRAYANADDEPGEAVLRARPSPGGVAWLRPLAGGGLARALAPSLGRMLGAMSGSGVRMAGGQLAEGRRAGSRRSSAGRPGSPPRQRWFVRRDTWDRERVIERCREWARQTGSPPSYYDWGPVTRAQAAGAPTSLAVKWEREHPDWPSAAVVYRYLRGWREMLSVAGFPTPGVIELPFAERVREALRLRADGLRWVEIGELLGISPDTARRYVHVHDCEGCGEPILAVGVRRCRRCSGAGRSRWGEPFSSVEIIAAIRAWRRLEG
jgi:Homeodomain-like domain